jgi:hypothetical protein
VKLVNAREALRSDNVSPADDVPAMPGARLNVGLATRGKAVTGRSGIVI